MAYLYLLFIPLRCSTCIPVHIHDVLRNLPVPVHGALILDNEDEVKAGQDGGLQVNVLLSCLHVIIPAHLSQIIAHHTLCLPQN